MMRPVVGSGGGRGGAAGAPALEEFFAPGAAEPFTVVELAEVGHLDHTLAALRRIDGVFEARRSLSTTRRR